LRSEQRPCTVAGRIGSALAGASARGGCRGRAQVPEDRSGAALGVARGQTWRRMSLIAPRDLGSVQLHRIEAVLCVPIGSDPIVGVLYLQARRGGGSFRDADVATARAFAGYFSAFAERC
jgi:GAF domain-containing protein